MAAPASSRATADVHVALLRGINVGGRNRLPMSVLAELFRAAGCREVRTYIQSGNVLFQAPPRLAQRVPELLAQRIAATLGLQVPVIVRSAAELARVAGRNPFLSSAADPAALHVAFLAQAPERKRVAALDPERSPGDAFLVKGREIYLHLPKGVAKTRITSPYLDATLDTVCTVRNWRTVQMLAELARA